MMYYASAVLVAALSSVVSGDLASLRRFAQGGPPPVPGVRQVAGGGLNSSPSSSPPVVSTDTRPPVEVTSAPVTRQDTGVFFPVPGGSKVVKHVTLPKVSTVVKSNPRPEHSTLLKGLDESDPGFVVSNSGNLDSQADLVRIPKNQENNPFHLQAPHDVPNTPRVQETLTLPTQFESQPAQPAFVRIPKIQPSNPVPSTPPPHAHNVQSVNKFNPDESLLAATDNTEVFSNPPQLSVEELELDAALSMIRNNWQFVKSGGRLIISRTDDDPIIIANDSLFRQ